MNCYEWWMNKWFGNSVKSLLVPFWSYLILVLCQVLQWQQLSLQLVSPVRVIFQRRGIPRFVCVSCARLMFIESVWEKNCWVPNTYGWRKLMKWSNLSAKHALSLPLAYPKSQLVAKGQLKHQTHPQKNFDKTILLKLLGQKQLKRQTHLLKNLGKAVLFQLLGQ